MAEPVLALDGIETCYGLSQVLFGVSLRHRAWRDGDADGPQRHGQNHDRALDHGSDAGARRRDPFHGARKFAACRHTRSAQRGIGLVPEGRQIFPNLSVRENLLATAVKRDGEDWTLAKVYALFPRLAERDDSMGNQLSGGEQQMLAIGRALMTNPRLLILDEATEGLAPLIRAEIWRCLASLKESGLSILVIDKNVGALMRVADRHFLIERGRVVWKGSSPELAAAPDVQHRYLGV